MLEPKPLINKKAKRMQTQAFSNLLQLGHATKPKRKEFDIDDISRKIDEKVQQARRLELTSENRPSVS